MESVKRVWDLLYLWEGLCATTPCRKARPQIIMPSGRKGSLILGLLVLIGTALPMRMNGATTTDSTIVYLDQGWTAEDRQEFYHLSPGTQLVPYDWFVALENGTDRERFKDMVDTFWLLPDVSNVDHLPVGLAPASGASLQGRQLGVTCAFCHTGQIRYKNHQIRIDGAPSMQYNARFIQVLLSLLAATSKNEKKFQSFGDSVLGTGTDTEKERAALKRQVGHYVLNMIARSSQDPSPFGWGFGRFDALGRGGNLVFSQLDPDNLRPANAPVSIPALWSSWEYDWVQWNGSIQHPLARNIAQVIGVNANLFTDPADPFRPWVDQSDPFRSSVDVKALIRLEELVKKLKPPRWPKEFPPIDMALAERGKQLYHGDKTKELKNLCAHCHVADPLPKPNAHGQRLRARMITQREVGTDPAQADNFKGRRADTGALSHVAGQARVAAKDAIRLITTEIMEREGVPVEGGNEIRAELKYFARPHTGVWATPPYLHNGSVPNIYELLSPSDDRHACFSLDPSLEYDPKHLGFVVRQCDGRWNPNDPTSRFEFETAKAGNSNRGHEFKDTATCGSDRKDPGILGCAIKHEDKMAIIEYLKTL